MEEKMRRLGFILNNTNVLQFADDQFIIAWAKEDLEYKALKMSIKNLKLEEEEENKIREKYKYFGNN